MAALSRVAQALRLDPAAWERFSRQKTPFSAGVIAMGAYALVAWDRFGFQALVAPRASARVLLIGFYGWLGLAALSRLVGRRLTGRQVDLIDAIRLYGVAHMPLLAVAVAAQAFGVMFELAGPGRVVAGFAATVWLPGQLLAATRALFGVGSSRAAAIVAVPYLAWVGLVGVQLARQIGHLL